MAGYGSCCRISPHKDLLLLRTGEAMYWGQFDFHRQSCLLFPLKISWKNEHLLNHLKNNLGLFKRWQQLLRSIYRGLLSAHGVLSASHGLTQFTKIPSQAQAAHLAVRLSSPTQAPWTNQREGDQIPPRPTDISSALATSTSYTGNKMK